MTRRYAESTTVPVDRSRGEISGILASHGVTRMGWMTDHGEDQLLFEIGGANHRLTIHKPTPEELRTRDGGNYVYPHNVDWQAKVDQEWKRRWRANVLLLKAKLEFIDAGDSTIERELLPFRVLEDGRTIEEAVLDGGRLLAAHS